MGLETLLKLDEAIWKQHEKITQKAQKGLGWNKYDLARVMEYGAVGSFLGSAIYNFIDFSLNVESEMGYGVAGLLWLGYCGIKYTGISYLKKKEEAEIDMLIKTGATIAPKYKSSRPLMCIMDTLLMSSGIGYLNSTDGSNKFLTLNGLLFITWGIGNLFEKSSSYFQDQIMAPPTKKKSFWKTMYQKAISPFRQKGFEPVAEPAKYQTIDRMVE